MPLGAFEQTRVAIVTVEIQEAKGGHGPYDGILIPGVKQPKSVIHEIIEKGADGRRKETQARAAIVQFFYSEPERCVPDIVGIVGGQVIADAEVFDQPLQV